MIVHAQRASLNASTHTGRSCLVVDLWSVDETWREGVAQARRTDAPVVLLSSIGLTAASDLTRYEQVLATREDVARTALPGAVTLRLAPVFEDLAVYDDALRSGQDVHHSYGPGQIAWLSARDVLDAADAASEAPAGQAFDLAGTDPGSAEDVLHERARRLGVPAPTIIDVPAPVLVEQLGAMFGAQKASAFVGHQVWAGRSAAHAEAGAQTLVSALGREPTPWRPRISR